MQSRVATTNLFHFSVTKECVKMYCLPLCVVDSFGLPLWYLYTDFCPPSRSSLLFLSPKSRVIPLRDCSKQHRAWLLHEGDSSCQWKVDLERTDCVLCVWMDKLPAVILQVCVAVGFKFRYRTCNICIYAILIRVYLDRNDILKVVINGTYSDHTLRKVRDGKRVSPPSTHTLYVTS